MMSKIKVPGQGLRLGVKHKLIFVAICYFMTSWAFFFHIEFLIILGIQATEVDMNGHHNDVTEVHPGLHLPFPTFSISLSCSAHFLSAVSFFLNYGLRNFCGPLKIEYINNFAFLTISMDLKWQRSRMPQIFGLYVNLPWLFVLH